MECYTEGGVSKLILQEHTLAVQTFAPTADHTIEFVDLELSVGLFTAPVYVAVHYANAHHEPTGDHISFGWLDPLPVFPPGVHRYRFKMSPNPLLHAGSYYCLKVFQGEILIGTRASWMYDPANATYPRGFKVVSLDDGATWSKDYGDDFMFAEFGTPHCPPPPPDPPITHWLAPGIYYQPTFHGLKITLVTNVPCHLWMYWTLEPPRKHRIPRLRRGVQFSDILQYCFVAWHKNEQAEPGDTCIHTYIKEPWPVCQTRYFIFRGNVDDQLSPSISAIFTKHRTPEETLWRYPPNRRLSDSLLLAL